MNCLSLRSSAIISVDIFCSFDDTSVLPCRTAAQCPLVHKNVQPPLFREAIRSVCPFEKRGGGEAAVQRPLVRVRWIQQKVAHRSMVKE